MCENLGEKEGNGITRKGRAVLKQIQNFVNNQSTPVSTRQIAKTLGYSWHTIQQYALELLVKKKIDRFVTENAYMWIPSSKNIAQKQERQSKDFKQTIQTHAHSKQPEVSPLFAQEQDLHVLLDELGRDTLTELLAQLTLDGSSEVRQRITSLLRGVGENKKPKGKEKPKDTTEVMQHE